MATIRILGGEEIHKEINKLASSVREKIKKETNE